MRKMNVGNLVNWCEGSLFLGDEEAVISGVGIDSRNIKKGEAFFAIKGKNFDGHNFIYSAISEGAGTIVASDCKILESEIKKYRKSEKNDMEIVQNPFINVILVEDTLKALQNAAKEYLKYLNIKVVAVTGSVGKTTVKDMIAAVCRSKYYTAKTQGNFNNEIGLPLTVLNMDEKTELAVLEMGMDHRGEIRKLVEIARPQIGVITNIGVSHIENLGSREAICEEKLDIASLFDEKSALVVNGEDDLLAMPKQGAVYTKILVGEEQCGQKMDVVISHIKSEGEITTFDVAAEFTENIESGSLCGDAETVSVRLPRAGRHSALNAALALGVAKLLCISLSEGAKALANAKYTGRRLEFKKAESGFTVIDDSYNASPDSMKAALSVLAKAQGKKKIAVLADMLEMGKDSDTYHYEVGEFLVNLNIDILLTYGKAASFIAKAVKENKETVKVLEFTDKEILTKELGEIVEKGDVVLFKGSNSMKMNEVADKILHK